MSTLVKRALQEQNLVSRESRGAACFAVSVAVDCSRCPSAACSGTSLISSRGSSSKRVSWSAHGRRSVRMTLESPKESSDRRSRQAVDDEFRALPVYPDKSVDEALEALLRRGRRMQAREHALNAFQRQMDALEMLTRVRLVENGRPTSATYVLIASHVMVLFLLATLVVQDVQAVSSVVAFLR